MDAGNHALVGLKDIAKVLGVSDYTIYYWVGRNEIPFIRVGRHLRFIAEDVIRYFAAKTEERKPNCHRRETRLNNGSQRCSLTIGAPARTRNFTSQTEE